MCLLWIYEHTTQWKCSDPKCINCGQNHHARSKECKFYIYNTELKILQERTGMSIKEAKLELKVRGIQDPSRKQPYSSITRIGKETKTLAGNSKEAQINKSQEEINDLEKENKIRKNKETGTNDMDNILSNSFEILMKIGAQEEDTAEVTNKGCEGPEIRDKKRPLERTPPKMKKPSINRETSVKPKTKDIKKEQKKPRNIPLSPKIIVKPMESDIQKTEEVEVNHNIENNDYVMGEEITPSPIIGKRRTNENQNMHDNTCGCNDCFVELCNNDKNITKDDLTNIIKIFIKLRKRESTDLSTHRKGCMCVERLKSYKEKKLNIVNTILEKIQTDNTKRENKSRPL